MAFVYNTHFFLQEKKSEYFFKYQINSCLKFDSMDIMVQLCH